MSILDKFRLENRVALVTGGNRGLGKQMSTALAEAGAQVAIVSRKREEAEAVAAQIQEATGCTCRGYSADMTAPEQVDTVAKQVLADFGQVDILVNNAGGPPPGDFREWDRETWVKAVDANMITPILMIRAVVDGMIARKFGRIVNITSGAVKAPIPELGLSNGARTGLTGFIAGLSRTTVRHNVTINNLLPGPFETDRLRSNLEFNAKKLGKTAAELRKLGWARLGSNQRPLGCKPSALPLSYAPR